MRKCIVLFVLILITGILLTGAGTAEARSDNPRIILFTYYRQMGWGDRVQIGFMDEDGNLRTISGYDSALNWPYKPEEQLQYLSSGQMKITEEKKLDHDDTFSIKSLVYDVEDQGSKSIPAANDAGTEKSYAVRYSSEGEPEFILLGMSGDDCFENSDPDAQALYLILRRLFPIVTSYAYGPIGPHGFIPVPFAEFIGLDTDSLVNAEIEAFYNDCEEGNIPMELTEKDKGNLLSLIQNGKVTGKADNIISTGGYNVFSFYDPEGNFIESISFYEGNLATNDGNWYYSLE